MQMADMMGAYRSTSKDCRDRMFSVIEQLFSEKFNKFRFQFVNAVRYGNDGAVAVDEEQSTILSAVFTEYSELVIKVNETGPRKGVTLDGLAHGIGGLEFVGEAEHVQATITILFI